MILHRRHKKGERCMTRIYLEDGEFIFIGKGIGVPGLPHKVHTEEAKAWAIGDELAAAVEAGTYRFVPEKKETEEGN